MNSVKKYVLSLRQFRKIHRYVGLALAVFLLISAVTGVLLGWKKNVDLLQPPTQKGQQTNLKEWLPLYHLEEVAQTALMEELNSSQLPIVDRIDARPSKGIVKVLFETGYWEVQVDATTGKVYSVAKRHSDFIEAIHDGSIIGDNFKLISMNILGFGLILLILAGWWLWYGPKLIRASKKRGE